jgi:hypothetical protein
MGAARIGTAVAALLSLAATAGCSPDSRSGPGADAGDDDTGCDCVDTEDESPEGLAAAINLCPGVDTFAASQRSTSDPPDAGEDTEEEVEEDLWKLGFGVRSQFGTSDCLTARQACTMLAIATGPLDLENPNDISDMGDDGHSTDLDPQPAYQGDSVTTANLQESCDCNQLRLALQVPAGKQGFSFDFLFASAEYPEFLGEGYNDTFYAIMEYDALNGGATTNIAFDDLDNEIEVDADFFENAAHPCDESGSPWSPTVDDGAGSTGWLRTSWPVAEGDDFSLTFSIHDEGDCFFDSMVLIDNFLWLDESPPGTTVPIE